MKWVQVDAAVDFYVLEYQATGYARANCCAIGTKRGYVILSPAVGVTEALIQELEKRGRILALLPPHPGHTLGINEWKSLRPKLPVYAAPGAMKRIADVCHVEVLPVSDLQLEDPNVKIFEAPGMNRTTVLAEVTGKDRSVVYADEILEDLDRYPGTWYMRPLMLLFGKRPGFQVNRGFIRFYVKDVKALKNEVSRMIGLNPHVVFAHGPVRSSAEDLRKTRALLDSI